MAGEGRGARTSETPGKAGGSESRNRSFLLSVQGAAGFGGLSPAPISAHPSLFKLTFKQAEIPEDRHSAYATSMYEV